MTKPGLSFSTLDVGVLVHSIEMKGITRCKLTIISDSAVSKKFLDRSFPTQPLYGFLIVIH